MLKKLVVSLILMSCLIPGSCKMDELEKSAPQTLPIVPPVIPEPPPESEPPEPPEINVDPENENAPQPEQPAIPEEPEEEIPAAEMIINELCTDSVIVSGAARAEFIEFRVTTGGNLGGLLVCIIANAAAPVETVYNFPSVNVEKDDYIVLHLRTTDSASKDELGANLAESGGYNSSANARDLWLSGTDKRIYKTAIVYLADKSGNIIDAIIISDNPASSWQTTQFIETAALLTGEGAWSGLPYNSSSTSSTRTINRYPTAGKTAAAWYTGQANSATPGRANN